MEKRRLILAIDADGTMWEHMFPSIGPALPGAFETLKRFKQKGDRLILWTCREGMYLQEAIACCKLNGIEFEEHNNNASEHNYDKSRKIYADLYIDDRMVGGFPGWDVVEAFVDRLRNEIGYTPSPIVPPKMGVYRDFCYCGNPVDTSNPDCVEFNLCKDHQMES